MYSQLFCTEKDFRIENPFNLILFFKVNLENGLRLTAILKL